MNLGVAKKSTVLGSPRFTVNWELKDKKEVERLYRDVVSNLPNKPFGMYNAYLRIFGEAVAKSGANKYPCK